MGNFELAFYRILLSANVQASLLFGTVVDVDGRFAHPAVWEPVRVRHGTEMGEVHRCQGGPAGGIFC